MLAGMGRLGTFREPQLRTLAASVTQSVGRLLPNPIICTVLIGAGFGNLTVSEAVSGLIEGSARALGAEPSLRSVTIRIVERHLDRAYEVLAAVRESMARLAGAHPVDLISPNDVIELDDSGGTIPVPFGFSMILASLAQACFDGETAPLDTLTKQLPAKLKERVLEVLKDRGKQRNAKQLGLAFRIVDHDRSSGAKVADRVSFAHDGARVHAAAITNLTTVKVTTMEVGLPWIDRVVEALRSPTSEVFEERGRRAFRTMVHPELRENMLQSTPVVLELDRAMARLPWELLHQGAGQPLGILRPLARQLRTAYSPRPSDVVVRTSWRALVIGNPDGSLPAAASEARAVRDNLVKAGISVELRIGPPDVLGLGTEQDVDPADLFEVVELLQTGDFDIVHYAGHAFFRPEFPDRSGWVFKDGTLTASMLEGVERMPRLVVANACVSAGVSTSIAGLAASGQGGTTSAPPPSDAGVVASLADEFFRRGVADYIGTAWEVAELPATVFAEALYRNFLGDRKAPPVSNQPDGPCLGEAVRTARETLFKQRAEFASPSVWAAYQHYGDPTRTLSDYRM